MFVADIKAINAKLLGVRLQPAFMRFGPIFKK